MATSRFPSIPYTILIIALLSISGCDGILDEDLNGNNSPDPDVLVTQTLAIRLDDAIKIFVNGEDARTMNLPGTEDLVVQINVYDFYAYPVDGNYYAKSAYFEYNYLLENPEVEIPLDPSYEYSIEVKARYILDEEQIEMLEGEGYEIEEVDIFNSFLIPPDGAPVRTVQLLHLWQWTPPFFTDPAYSWCFFGAWSDLFQPDPNAIVDIVVDELWGPQAFAFDVNDPNGEIPGQISVAMSGGWEEAYWEEDIGELPDYLYTNEYVWWIKLTYTSPAGNRYVLASENFEEFAHRRLVLFHLILNVPELEFDEDGELTNFDTGGSRTVFIRLPEYLWEEVTVEIGD